MASPNLCCCCSLKTGGIIISILDIIGGILILLGAIGMFGLGVAVKKTQDPTYGRNPDPDVGVVSTMAYVVAAVLLVVAICSILIGVLLLTGIRKKSPFLLKIWIIIRVILLVMTILGSIGGYNSGNKPAAGNQQASSGMQTSINIIASLLFGVWFISVVHYLRKEFLDDQSGNMAPVSFKP